MDQVSPIRMKQGRRAGAEDVVETGPDGLDGPQTNMSPKPARKQGAWGDDPKKKSKKKQSEDYVDERLRPDAMIQLVDDADDIPVIPDLDDVNEDDLAQQVAAPPSVQVTRVATYRELDSAFDKHAGLFSVDGGIDLKLLSKALAVENEVFEEDKVWEWDRIFTEVASDLQAELLRASEETTAEG